MDQARALLIQFHGPQAYFIFYFLLLGCGIGLPLNSDLLMIAASLLAAMGSFKLTTLVPLAILGLLNGDAINYWVARKFGKKLLNLKPFCYILKPKQIEKAELYLQQKGTGFLFLVRFLPFIRTALYFTAGFLQVPLRTFFTLNALSTLLYVPLLMGLVYSLGDDSHRVVVLLKQFQHSLLSVGLIAGVTFVLIRKKGNV